MQVRKSSLFVLSAGFLFGTAGTAVALGPNGVSGVSAGFSRLIIGAIFLFLVIPSIGGNWLRAISLVKNPLVWVMGLSAGLFQPLFFGATQRSGVALGTLITVGTAPIFAGLISRIFMKEKLNVLWIISTLLAIFGLALRSISEIANVDPLGIFMAVGAGFSIGTYTAAAKVALKKGLNAIELPAISYLIGAVILSPILINQEFDWLLTKSGLVMAIYLGIITMALANVLYVLGLRELSAGPTATLLLADPLTATLLGYFLLNESITTLGWIGIALVSAALVLQSLSRESNDRFDLQQTTHKLTI